MKTKLRHIFLSSIIEQSQDDLPLTKRECTMIKWFLKFNTTLVMITIAWYMPVKAINQHLYEYENLKAQVVDMSVQIPEAQASSSFQAILKSGDSTREDELPILTSDKRKIENQLPDSQEKIKQQITEIAISKNFKDVDYLLRLAKCESTFNQKAIGTNKDKHNSKDRGLFQINSYWHREVSDECAFNVKCSTEWTIDMINKGQQGQWSCDKKI